MEVVFLGTGTSGGVPMVGCTSDVCLSKDPKDKRLRSSIMLREDDQTIVIDCSPDFRQQMLRENEKQVHAIVFTHSHKDHTGGLDDIRGYNYVMQRAMPLYMTQETLEIIKKQYDYIFSGSGYPGIPKVDINIIDNAPFQIGTIKFTPIKVLHYHMTVLGFRIKDFTYITDANFISENEKEKIRGSKIIVLNALRKEPHISHFTLTQAVELIKELKPEKAYFTHMSHQIGFHDEVNKELPENMQLAFDGLKLNV